MTTSTSTIKIPFLVGSLIFLSSSAFRLPASAQGPVDTDGVPEQISEPAAFPAETLETSHEKTPPLPAAVPSSAETAKAVSDEMSSADKKRAVTAVCESPVEIVVSASRRAQKKNEVPNRILTISPKDAALRNPQTSADLLGSSAEAFIQKSQLGGGSPMLRGFSANRLLIMIDGVRMNNAIYRSGNLQNVISIDPNALENVEIILGPGSIVYGSDAIGGVMDFRSLVPSFSPDGTPRLSGNVMARVSSADFEKTGHLDFTVGLKKVAFSTSVTRSDFDDLRMGSRGHTGYTRPEYVRRVNDSDIIVINDDRNVQVSTGYDQINIIEKVRYAPTTSLEIRNSFHFSTTSNIPRYDRLIAYRSGSLRYGDWYYGPQKWLMNALSVNCSCPCRLFDESQWVAAYQSYEESRHSRARGNPVRLDQVEKVQAGSFNADLWKRVGAKGTLSYGLEAVYNGVVSEATSRGIVTGTGTPAASRYPNSNYSTGALYAGYKHAFNTVWLVSGGARWNYVRADGTFDTTLIHLPYDKIELRTGAFNGSVGLVCTPEPGLQMTFNLSSGFRAPNVDDMGKLFDPASGTVIVPNRDLGPEYAFNAEACLAKSFGSRLKIDISGFYTRLNDAMVRRNATFNGMDTIVYNGDPCRVLAIVNADHAYVYGAGGTLTLGLTDRFSLKASAVSIRGEEQDETTGTYYPLRHAAPPSAGICLAYADEKLNVELYGNYNDEIAFNKLALTERDKPDLYASDQNGNPFCPSWHTLNVKAFYRINRNLSLSGGVENIFDVRYRPYSSGIVAPGRNFIVSMRSSF